MKTGKQALKELQKAEAVETLKEMGVEAGSTIYTILRSCSSSGMNRKISLVFINDMGEIQNISSLASKAMGERLVDKNGHWAISVSGCGMDMGYDLVYRLSRAMFPDGFIPAEAGKTGRNGSDSQALDRDGGYCLNQRWL